MNLGINLGMGSAAMMGGNRDANSIINTAGEQACVALVEALPGLGTIGVSSATLDTTLDDWYVERVAAPVLQPDGSYRITATAGTSSSHLILSPAITGGISAPSYITVRAKNVSGLIGVWLTLNASTALYMYFDGTTSTPPDGVEVLNNATAGVYRTWTLRMPASAVAQSVRIAPVKSTSTVSFASDGTESADVQLTAYTQTRASAWNNLARQGGALVDPVGFVQGTPATQPLAWNLGASYNLTPGGIWVPYKEAGRASYMATTDADVLAAVSGDDPAWCAGGIGKWSGDGNGPLYMIGSGSIAHSLVISGANMTVTRHDGTNTSSVNLGSATPFASWCSWYLEHLADRTVNLYVNGALSGTGTLGDLAAATMTSFQIGRVSLTTGTAARAALAVWKGQLPSGHATALPILNAWRARYGVTA